MDLNKSKQYSTCDKKIQHTLEIDTKEWITSFIHWKLEALQIDG